MRSMEVVIGNFKVRTLIYSDISENSMENEIIQRLLSSRIVKTESAVKSMIKDIDERWEQGAKFGDD